MAERFNATVLKTVEVHASEGSNPSLSAKVDGCVRIHKLGGVYVDSNDVTVQFRLIYGLELRTIFSRFDSYHQLLKYLYRLSVRTMDSQSIKMSSTLIRGVK